MPIKPKYVEKFPLNNLDQTTMFVARNGKNEILAEFEHKNRKTVENTYKVLNQQLKSSRSGNEFWKKWDNESKRFKI